MGSLCIYGYGGKRGLATISTKVSMNPISREQLPRVQMGLATQIATQLAGMGQYGPI
jgi:hypothetical protein